MKDALIEKIFTFRLCQRGVENENDTELCKTLQNASHEFYAICELLLSLVMF